MAESYVELNGLILTSVEESGVEWVMDSFQGWEGVPQPTLDPVQNVRANGTWSGESYMGGRSMSGSGWVSAPTQELLTDAITRLNAACALEAVPMRVVEFGLERFTNVRQSGELLVQTTDLEARWSFQVHADDPRKLHDELTNSTLLPSVTGGLTVPFTVPFTIAATQVSGQVSLMNPGNTAGPVRLRIDGPCPGPVITHVNSGRSLVFASSLVLGAGEWLEIDMDARTVLANGQANRRMYVTSAGWSAFEPGDNTWSFTANAYNAASLLTVFATPADK